MRSRRSIAGSIVGRAEGTTARDRPGRRRTGLIVTAVLTAVALSACTGLHDAPALPDTDPHTTVLTRGTMHGAAYALTVGRDVSDGGVCLTLRTGGGVVISAGCGLGGDLNEFQDGPATAQTDAVGDTGPGGTMVDYGVAPTTAVAVRLREFDIDGAGYVGPVMLVPVHPMPAWLGHGTWWGPVNVDGKVYEVVDFVNARGRSVPRERL